MDITSLGFLLFLGGGVTLFYSIPQKYRWKWLIVLSFAFVYAASTIGLFFVVLNERDLYISQAKKIEEVDDRQEKEGFNRQPGSMSVYLNLFEILIWFVYFYAGKSCDFR